MEEKIPSEFAKEICNILFEINQTMKHFGPWILEGTDFYTLKYEGLDVVTFIKGSLNQNTTGLDIYSYLAENEFILQIDGDEFYSFYKDKKKIPISVLYNTVNKTFTFTTETEIVETYTTPSPQDINIINNKKFRTKIFDLVSLCENNENYDEFPQYWYGNSYINSDLFSFMKKIRKAFKLNFNLNTHQTTLHDQDLNEEDTIISMITHSKFFAIEPSKKYDLEATVYPIDNFENHKALIRFKGYEKLFEIQQFFTVLHIW